MEYTPREQAAIEGRMTYEGRACPNCGGSERYVSTAQCVPCTRRKAKESHERIRELRRQASAKVASS